MNKDLQRELESVADEVKNEPKENKRKKVMKANTLNQTISNGVKQFKDGGNTGANSQERSEKSSSSP